MWVITLKNNYKPTKKLNIEYFQNQVFSLPLTDEECRRVVRRMRAYKLNSTVYDNESGKVVATLSYDENLTKYKRELIVEPRKEKVKTKVYKTKLAKLAKPDDLVTFREAEISLINKALDYTNDNKLQSAKLLGVCIRTLRNKIRQYGIRRYE